MSHNWANLTKDRTIRGLRMGIGKNKELEVNWNYFFEYFWAAKFFIVFVLKLNHLKILNGLLLKIYIC